MAEARTGSGTAYVGVIPALLIAGVSRRAASFHKLLVEADSPLPAQNQPTLSALR